MADLDSESPPGPDAGAAMPAPAAAGASSVLASRVDVVPERHAVHGPGVKQPVEGAPGLPKCPGCGSTGARNLVVCIDGTSNQFSTKNTNVVELYSRLVKNKTQLTFYNSGIGTYAKPSWGSWSYLKQVIANKLDLAFALRLEKIIISAYAWLVDNYEEGDRIFLFGFSRGAYQVRALAAMIETVGLLHKGNNDQIAFAYELYAAPGDDKPGSTVSGEAAARRVWLPSHDRLQSMGESAKRAASFIYSKLGLSYVSRMGRKLFHSIRSIVSRILPSREGEDPSFPQPISISQPRAERAPSKQDEMEKQFKSTFSRKVTVHFVGAWDTVSSVGFVRDKTLPSTTEGMKFVCFFRHALALHEYRVKFLPEYANGGDGPDPQKSRDGFTQPHTKEVWFTGSHSDIGGGSTANTTLDKFGPALRWMSWEATLAGLRLDNSPREWEQIGVSNSMTAIWRIIECLPIKHLSYQEPREERHWLWMRSAVTEGASSRKQQPVTRRPHFAANRRIKPGQRIHQSVYTECAKFTKPSGVEKELDAYIEASDILRPQQDVLRSGYLLGEQDRKRLKLLQSSAQGIQALGELHLVQYIYDLSQSCRNSEGEAQIQKDLQSLHTAYVTGRFGGRSHTGMLEIDRKLSQSGTFPFHMCGHERTVSSVAFLSNMRVVSGSWDKTLRIWDVSTGAMTLGGPLSGHSASIYCVAVHAAKDLVASASSDSTIRLWISDSNGAVHAGKVLQDECRGQVLAVAFSPDGSHLVSGSSDRAIRVWNAATGERVGQPVRGHTAWVRSVAFSSDGKKIVWGSDDRDVQLWEWSADDATLKPCREPLSGHNAEVLSVAFSPDASLIASGAMDKTVRIWDVGTRTSKFTLEGHTDDVCSVAFAPSGTHVVSGSDDWTVCIWDARAGAAVRVLRGHASWVRSVAFSPDGTRIASGSGDNTVRVWEFVPPPDESHLVDDDVQAAAHAQIEPA